MPVPFSAGVVTFFLLASLTACCCKGTQEESLLAKVEHADTDNVTTAGVAGAVTTPEPRNDTRTEVTSQANSLRDGSASGPKASSSGWDTVYKLLYETFSYPEAKELEALLPLPSTYLTRKQRRDRKDDNDRKKEQQQHATRELTYRTVGTDDGSGDHPTDPKDGAYDQGVDPGSSESSSQSEEEEDGEEEEEGRESGDPYAEDDDDDDGAEMADDIVKRKTASSSSTAAPSSSSKAHRRTERSVPATGTLLPPPRPWRERGKDFGLPVPEDRWSKHVAAKRREAQLIRRSLQDQLRMKALQWRQKENHFHQRYKPAVATGTI